MGGLNRVLAALATQLPPWWFALTFLFVPELVVPHAALGPK
jgi:hypothetical protein